MHIRRYATFTHWHNSFELSLVDVGKILHLSTKQRNHLTLLKRGKNQRFPTERHMPGDDLEGNRQTNFSFKFAQHVVNCSLIIRGHLSSFVIVLHHETDSNDIIVNETLWLTVNYSEFSWLRRHSLVFIHYQLFIFSVAKCFLAFNFLSFRK